VPHSLLAVTTSAQRTLTPRVQHFINEYITDFNGKQAAIRAGYSPKTAENQASRLLRNAQVATAIARIRGQLQKKAGLTAERVVEELACIGFVDPRDVFEATGVPFKKEQFPEHLARAIASFKVTITPTEKGKPPETSFEVRFWDKPKALHTAAHILGMLKEKLELSGPEGKPVRVSFGGRYRPTDGAGPGKR
jgi:phage terminase small subunit